MPRLDGNSEIGFEDQEWRKQANCRGLPTAIFFPENKIREGLARSVCAECVVRDVCLEYALDNNEQYGVWGGTSEKDRRYLRRQRKTRSA